MKRKLIVISNDAMVREDMEYLLTKPPFKQLIKEGSWIKTMKTVYPSITYCCHASMITGANPAKTGVTNNNIDGWRQADWMWERNYILR
ncbi:MAG: alkaline phosphatase family protein [Clostridia bacterium]|nr:alkaline phosphatase family protein [Clostridia bacterium]